MDVETEIAETVETKNCRYCGGMVYLDREGDWRHVYPTDAEKGAS
jgi:hypothetical protein